MSVSFERDNHCNLENMMECFETNKSLVVSFWREESQHKWLSKNLLKVFDARYFTHIIMLHDNSSWTSYPNRESIIWIYVDSQKRFWYLKRFLTPAVMKTYRFLWIIDDDVELLFNPLHYECVVSRLNVSLSAPGRMAGIASHVITRVNNDFVRNIGRWTDFIEIGPMFVIDGSTWNCMWHFLSSFVGLGWGLDLVWCKLIVRRCLNNFQAQHACAILDTFHVNHLSESIGSTEAGTREIPAYNLFYGDFHTTQTNIAPLAKDLAVYFECNKTINGKS